jgi:hypothetical protein
VDQCEGVTVEVIREVTGNEYELVRIEIWSDEIREVVGKIECS